MNSREGYTSDNNVIYSNFAFDELFSIWWEEKRAYSMLPLIHRQ
jgi:hypothetical protein